MDDHPFRSPASAQSSRRLTRLQRAVLASVVACHRRPVTLWFLIRLHGRRLLAIALLYGGAIALVRISGGPAAGFLTGLCCGVLLMIVSRFRTAVRIQPVLDAIVDIHRARRVLADDALPADEPASAPG